MDDLGSCSRIYLHVYIFLIGDKDDLISRLAEKKREAEDESDTKTNKKMKLLNNSSSSSSISNKNKSEIMIHQKIKLNINNLPSNMNSMGAEQLRSVCACNGMLHLLTKDMTKSDILDIIENELYGNDGEKKKKQVESDDGSDASDDGGSDRE